MTLWSEVGVENFRVLPLVELATSWVGNPVQERTVVVVRSQSKKKTNSYLSIHLLFQAALSLCALGPLHAEQEIVLAWDPVPNPAVAGYVIYHGTQSRVYDTRVDIGTNSIARLPNLKEGTLYFFAVTAYNKQLLESDYSQEVHYVTPGTNAVSPYVKIVQQPEARAVALNSNVTFRVVATGGGTLSYQWRKNGENLPGARSAAYTVNGVDTNAAGVYTVVVGNVLGQMESFPAVLRVIHPARVESVVGLPDGSRRLVIGNADGTPMALSQVFRFGVEISHALGESAFWMPVESPWMQQPGGWVLEDTRTSRLRSRFRWSERYYRVVYRGEDLGALRIDPPERAGEGRLRFRARFDTGTRALTPGEVGRIRCQATDDPTFPDGWETLADPPEWVDGAAVMETTVGAGQRRFFRTVMTGSAAPSVRLRPVPVESMDTTRLRLEGADGQALAAADLLNYEVWASASPRSDSDWEPVTGAVAFQDGKLIVDDAGAAGATSRYYRVFQR